MKKSLTIGLFMALLVAPLVGWSQTQIPNVGSAQELLTQAQSGQRELLNSILKLKENVRELRDRSSFEEFYGLLDNFERLAEEFRLNEIYPGVVEELGRDMVLHGNRWLRLSKDSSETILDYQSWADIVVANRFQSQVEEELKKIDNNSAREKAFSNLLTLRNWAQKKFSDDLYLVPGYNRLLGDLSLKALINTDPSEVEQWQFWLPGLSSQMVAEDYISYLNMRFLQQTFTQEQAQGALELLVAVGLHLETITYISTSVKRNFGVLVADTVSVISLQEKNMNPEAFSELLVLLDVSSLRDLTYRWVNPAKGASEQYSLELIQLSQVLSNRLSELRLTQSARDLEKFVNIRFSPVILTESGLEGTYKLYEEGTQNVWFFTIIREREDRIIAALSSENSFVNLSFFNIQYDLEKGVFRASENVPDDEPFSNFTVEISFSEESVATVKLPFSSQIEAPLVGEKIESYSNVLAQADVNATAIEGEYVGSIEINGEQKAYRLIVTNFGEYSVGRLESESGNIRIELNKGDDGKLGYIYLTSGRTQRGSWFHLRLKQSGDSLIGSAIVGGMGELGPATFEKL
jgi:hypothetical protein